MVEETKYRVRAGCPLIQITAANPTARTRIGVPEHTQRHFYAGDFLPGWVPAAEVRRLTEMGFVEVAS